MTRIDPAPVSAVTEAYERKGDLPGTWATERINQPEGDVDLVVFHGCDSERRAREYAVWDNARYAPAPAVNDESELLIEDLRAKAFGLGKGLGPSRSAVATAERALLNHVAGLEAEVERLTTLAEAAEVPRGLYLALADAAPGLWHGGHRCDGAIVVGSPGERVTIGQDMPAADARAAADAVNFVRRLDAARRGRATEGEAKDG